MATISWWLKPDKGREEQVGPGTNAETFGLWLSDKFNCTGLFQAAASPVPPFHSSADSPISVHTAGSVHCAVCWQWRSTSSYAGSSVTVRSSKGGTFRARASKLCVEEIVVMLIEAGIMWYRNKPILLAGATFIQSVKGMASNETSNTNGPWRSDNKNLPKERNSNSGEHIRTNFRNPSRRSSYF